jgi:hypothetical protein
MAARHRRCPSSLLTWLSSNGSLAPGESISSINWEILLHVAAMLFMWQLQEVHAPWLVKDP